MSSIAEGLSRHILTLILNMSCKSNTICKSGIWMSFILDAHKATPQKIYYIFRQEEYLLCFKDTLQNLLFPTKCHFVYNLFFHFKQYSCFFVKCYNLNMSCNVLIQLFQCTAHHSMVKTALCFLQCEYFLIWLPIMSSVVVSLPIHHFLCVNIPRLYYDLHHIAVPSLTWSHGMVLKRWV
jgi:hypothetical protein